MTVYGNKNDEPWLDPQGAQFIGNELRDCNFVGLTMKFVGDPPVGVGCGAESRHMITPWGDGGGPERLTSNPNWIKVTDSDDEPREGGQNVQTYNYYPYNPVTGWMINYVGFSPYFVNIVTLSPPDYVCSGQGQTVVGSYEIEQDEQTDANALEYIVGNTDTRICTYETTLDYETNDVPQIVKYYEEQGPWGWPREYLTVDWDLSNEPVQPGTWVTITTKFLLPRNNEVVYDKVQFRYSGSGDPKPAFGWEIVTPPDSASHCSGYVVGAFELYSDPGGSNCVGRYRLQHEYDPGQSGGLHDFQLFSLEATTTYYISDLRFGHSSTLLSKNEMWAFSSWHQENPAIQPLPAGGSILDYMDWGQMPCIPALSEYGLVVLALLLLGAAVLVLRLRRVTAM